MPSHETADINGPPVPERPDELSAAEVESLCAQVADAVAATSVFRVAKVLGISRGSVGSIVARRATRGTLTLAWLRSHRLAPLVVAATKAKG